MGTRKLPDYLPEDWPDSVDIPTREEWLAASKETEIFDKYLAQIKKRPPKFTSTPESIATGEQLMDEMKAHAAAEMTRRIKKGELLTSGEMQEALAISQAKLDELILSNRWISLIGPDCKEYYPAFYCDANLDRKALKAIDQELATLSNSSRYAFYISGRTNLGGTPLEALRCGRVEDVVLVARAYAES